MLLNPRAYLSRSSKIGPQEGCKNIFENMLEIFFISYFWTNVGPTPLKLFLNTFQAPNITKLSFFIFRQLLLSYDQNLHYMTQIFKPDNFRPGCFSICLPFSTVQPQRCVSEYDLTCFAIWLSNEIKIMETFFVSPLGSLKCKLKLATNPYKGQQKS